MVVAHAVTRAAAMPMQVAVRLTPSGAEGTQEVASAGVPMRVDLVAAATAVAAIDK